MRGGVAVEPVLGSRSWDVLAGIGPPPLAALADARWEVSGDSDRVGIRLSGPALERERQGELPSEGMCRGALQVPPSGQPVLFLADHPVTGGYPVIAYVRDDDVDRCAQLRPGQVLRLVTGTRPG